MEWGKDLNNKQIAKLLRAVSAAYEINDESRFKIVAYDRAAVSVEHATSEVKDLWDDDKLQSLPGIGASLASHLDELFRTGRVKHFQQVMKNLPPAMFELLEIPGIGAKTAWKLCENLGIKSEHEAIERLEKAAQEGKIRSLPGFGEDSEEKILDGIEQFRRREGRLLLFYAWGMAQKIIDYLKQEKAALAVDPLGSLRRKCATVGDIDLAVATNQPQKVIDHFLNCPFKKRKIEAGENSATLLLRSGQSVDLMTKPPRAYGALLQHFTGSKLHNIHLRKLAQKKGLSLSEYGIKKGSKLLEFKSEKDFYRYLGLAWIPPELREDAGEIEAAAKNELPGLVELKDIRGDLHLHSDFEIEPSHDLGENSMEEIVKKAIGLGYQYLAFSEHNPSVSQHSSGQIYSILSRKKEAIDKLRYSLSKSTQKVKIFNSLEIDIKPNGELGVPEKGLKTLDFAIVSVHTSFKLDKNQMTQRILRALAYPQAKILGHPTGRMLGTRDGYELDWEKIFDFCLKKKKALEINACPKRLDLPDTLVREAVKLGVKMIISTDAHSLEEMDNMPFGVSVARRGWAGKGLVLNTWLYAKIENWLKG